MKKLIRYTAKTLAWMAAILIIIWLGLLAYVAMNEKALISKISEVAAENTRGQVDIGGLSVSLLSTFPVLSLQLKDVTLRDSLFAIHKKDFFAAENVFVSVDLSSIFSGGVSVGRVVVRDARINILTDSTGYSNEYVMKGREGAKDSSKPANYPTVILKRVIVSYVNPLRNKNHEGNFRELRCKISERDSIMAVDLNMNVLLKGLAFNTNKGAFLGDKKLDGRFTLTFNKKQSDLIIPNVRINIDGHPFHFTGKFHFDKVSPDFNLNISAYNIKFDQAVSVLSDTLQSRLNFYSFTKPIDLTVELNGKTLYKYTPAARIITTIDLNAANSFGSTVLELEKGKAEVNILLNGPIGRGDSTIDKISGDIKITGANLHYLPRDIRLSNLQGLIAFKNDDVLVRNFMGNIGSTKLRMNGIAKRFVSVLNKQPEQLNVVFNIQVPSLNLEDFRSFLRPAKAIPTASGETTSASAQVDKIFTDGDINVILETPKMSYKSFRATDIKADVLFRKSEIALQQVALRHAKGAMEVRGVLKNGKEYNPVTLHASLKGMDIPLLFSAFDNFGQDAVTNENLRGTVSAEVDFQSSVTNDAKLITPASEGSVKFVVENGELNNFQPLIALGDKVFKKQDFSRIEFADLRNTLDIKGSAFIVNSMDIRSTALNLTVEGVYDLKKGTDMSIRLPVQNLTRSQAGTDLREGVKAKKGVSLRLRARTGDDGKLKITWDPFRRSLRNKQHVSDSADAGD